jgi:uncharacterized protein with NRDE domain
MCLIFLSYQQNPKYPLIVLANRDEFYKRKSAQASFWPGGNILAGKDLEAGGTWLGLNRQGSIAMITNYRDPANIKANAPSRGKLVADFLIGNLNPERYLLALDRSADLFNGYNLILGSLTDPWYYSNYQKKIYRLGTGLYGLSNKLLDSPWPKVTRGKTMLADLLMSDILDYDLLFAKMLNAEQAAEDELPDTGIDKTLEKAISPMFIQTDVYGTRCTTLITLNAAGEVYFEERTYDSGITGDTTVAFNFKI